MKSKCRGYVKYGMFTFYSPLTFIAQLWTFFCRFSEHFAFINNRILKLKGHLYDKIDKENYSFLDINLLFAQFSPELLETKEIFAGGGGLSLCVLDLPIITVIAVHLMKT